LKSKVFVFLLFFLTFMQLHARGAPQAQENEIKTQNDEWILCITEFNTSSLVDGRINIAGRITRMLVERLNAINYRTRISPEYAYYEQTAWARARSDAAKALAAKQNERSALIYRGDSGWVYRRNIERIDADIDKLRLALEEVDRNAPHINREPVFGLTAGNLDFSFPSAPPAGSELRFCHDQGSDALLTGTITDFYGRFLVSLRLYTVYTRSFVWEDSVIFSLDDLEEALDEITRKLLIVLSGNQSAAVAVTAHPEDTLVLINRSFAARGEPLNMEFAPGLMTISASAPNHESLTFETELFPGETVDISINLKPIEYGNVFVTGDLAGSVYHGALYVGEAPLTLRLPLYRMEFLELETPDNTRGKAVFRMPDDSGFAYSLFLNTELPLAPGIVDRARRNFYWAWGGTWITGIAAWIAYHSYISSDLAIRRNYASTGIFDQSQYDDNIRLYYVSMGTAIAFGIAVIFDIFFISRYILTANKGTTSVIGTNRN